MIHHTRKFLSKQRFNRPEYIKQYELAHKEQINLRKKKWRLNNLEKDRISKSKQYQKLKLEVFNHYSNNNIKCLCCTESHYEFLTIDHIENNGKAHRRFTKASNNLYWWLKSNGYPLGFQVLCMNCNWYKGKNTNHICVHQLENTDF